MARPTKYSQELADAICQAISRSSNGLSRICETLDISYVSVYKWLNEYEEFAKQYARAREEQADFLADEIIEIADDGSKDTKQITGRDGALIDVEDTEWTNRSKLKVDARKWKASKLAPKKYGDKIQNDLTINSVPILSFDPFKNANTGNNSLK